jgi:dolichol-phosphate mannosyltransferase
MDADLQDPPELISTMIDKLHEGYRVVYTQSISRQKESYLKRFTGYLFYRVLKRLAQVDIPVDTGDFC